RHVPSTSNSSNLGRISLRVRVGEQAERSRALRGVTHTAALREQWRDVPGVGWDFYRNPNQSKGEERGAEHALQKLPVTYLVNCSMRNSLSSIMARTTSPIETPPTTFSPITTGKCRMRFSVRRVIVFSTVSSGVAQMTG